MAPKPKIFIRSGLAQKDLPTPDLRDGVRWRTSLCVPGARGRRHTWLNWRRHLSRHQKQQKQHLDTHLDHAPCCRDQRQNKRTQSETYPGKKEAGSFCRHTVRFYSRFMPLGQHSVWEIFFCSAHATTTNYYHYYH